jgi:hypothetical protein
MHLKRLRRDDTPSADRAMGDALDELLDSFDTLFFEGRFDKADEMLEAVAVRSVSTTMLIGFLTATLPAKSKLRKRAAFFESVRGELLKRGETDVSLLQGLE